MTNVFAASADLSAAYINLKFGTVTKTACIAVREQAASVIEMCKTAKSEVYENGPSVHGARQQSRLDMLDQWENKACAVFDNASDMMMKVGA